MSDEGMSGWAGYMLGRASVEQDAFLARQRQIVQRMFNRPAVDTGHQALREEAIKAGEHIMWLDSKLDEVKAELAAEKERTARLESDLAAEREKSAKLYRDRERSAALMMKEMERRTQERYNNK